MFFLYVLSSGTGLPVSITNSIIQNNPGEGLMIYFDSNGMVVRYVMVDLEDIALYNQSHGINI